jgi:hypothetical protein
VDVLGEGRGDPGSRRRLVVRLGEAAAPADHLAEGPERDPVAVRRGAAFVPPDVVGEAVDVVQELAREPGLADPRRTIDRHEADPTLARGGVEELLEQPEVLIAADEGRFEDVSAIPAAHPGHHAQGSPGGDRRRLALEGLGPCGLERDRPIGGALGRLADEDRPGERDRLEPRSGIDEVSGDHPLVHRAEGDRRLTRQHPGPRLDPGTEAADHIHHVQGCPHGAFRVVLAGDRGAPDGHDRVADELLDDPAVPPDHVPCQLEVSAKKLARLLGIATLGERGEADEVCEYDRHHAAFRDRFGPCRHDGSGR